MARRAAEAGQDDGVEFQTLGLVDGHELQGVAGGDIRQRVQLAHLLGEARGVGDVAALFQFIQQVEVHARVFEIGGRVHACRAAEREPCAFHDLAQATAATQGKGTGQYGVQLRNPLANVSFQACTCGLRPAAVSRYWRCAPLLPTSPDQRVSARTMARAAARAMRCDRPDG